MSEPSKPTPPKPTPRPPSPAVLAGRRAPAAAPAATPAAVSSTPSTEFGRVAEDGTVYVRTPDGERAVGSYPGSTEAEALAYFARKYDELAAAAGLLRQRLERTDVSAQEARESLERLREQVGEANVVGDLPALEGTIEAIETQVARRVEEESQHRAQARAEAAQQREALVTEAEQLAGTDPARMQWKVASARMRELFEEWKAHQRRGPRLDKATEHALWQRFSAARNTFDKTRRSWFSQLDEQHQQAKRAKERLVAEAEQLAGSRDWGPTAGAFKQLMQQWRQAGRAQKRDDDALWARFKAAQDRFFAAKDEVVAAEEAEFRQNLAVKEGLLAEAEALLPVTDLDAAKAALRSIQERWESAGKVPRADLARVEGRLRKVEQTVRDHEQRRWQRSDPERLERARSMVTQLEEGVAGLEADLARAREHGDARAEAEAEQALAARQQWLQQARSGLAELEG